jgi:hypothetical protein
VTKRRWKIPAGARAGAGYSSISVVRLWRSGSTNSSASHALPLRQVGVMNGPKVTSALSPFDSQQRTLVPTTVIGAGLRQHPRRLG